MNRVITLTLWYEEDGEQLSIHPAVIQDNEYLILVDCGYEGFSLQIEQELQKHQMSLSDVTHIILTHPDFDHSGGLLEIKDDYPDIIVIAHENEADAISGKCKSARLLLAEKWVEEANEEQLEFCIAFRDRQKRIKPIAIDRTVQYGEILDYCGGIEILDTHGHTPGHMSLYVRELDTVITGDAAITKKNRLYMSNPYSCLDLKQAKESYRKIVAMKAHKYSCYHGGEIKNY